MDATLTKNGICKDEDVQNEYIKLSILKTLATKCPSSGPCCRWESVTQIRLKFPLPADLPSGDFVDGRGSPHFGRIWENASIFSSLLLHLPILPFDIPYNNPVHRPPSSPHHLWNLPRRSFTPEIHRHRLLCLHRCSPIRPH